jgi:hypothetical protein
VKIFGRDWQQIQSAQQGGPLDCPAQPIDQAAKDTVFLTGDKALLERYGLQELKNRGYWGVVDRLERNGIVEKEVDGV